MHAALHLVVEDGVDRMHIWSARQPVWRAQRENVVNMCMNMHMHMHVECESLPGGEHFRII